VEGDIDDVDVVVRVLLSPYVRPAHQRVLQQGAKAAGRESGSSRPLGQACADRREALEATEVVDVLRYELQRGRSADQARPVQSVPRTRRQRRVARRGLHTRSSSTQTTSGAGLRVPAR
jgi:hypothetical protein